MQGEEGGRYPYLSTNSKPVSAYYVLNSHGPLYGVILLNQDHGRGGGGGGGSMSMQTLY